MGTHDLTALGYSLSSKIHILFEKCFILLTQSVPYICIVCFKTNYIQEIPIICTAWEIFPRYRYIHEKPQTYIRLPPLSPSIPCRAFIVNSKTESF